MTTTNRFIFQQKTAKTKIIDIIIQVAKERDWESFSAFVAFATVSGVTLLKESVLDSIKSITNTHWTLGLDDFITHPQAIRLCREMPNPRVKVAKLSPQAIFHPKAYLFSSKSEKKCVLILGSANLTYGGLKENQEAMAIIRANTVPEFNEISEFINLLLESGSTLSSKKLAEYEEKFNAQRKIVKHSKAASSKNDILTSDDAIISPSLAKVCWIEVGKNTLMGKELEFKREQALFFGLNPSQKTDAVMNFDCSGKIIEMQIKWREHNRMWRLLLSKEIDQVAEGLRPTMSDHSQGRSPFVAVFERTESNKISLKFIDESCEEYDLIKSKSKAANAIGRTTARQYGWY